MTRLNLILFFALIFSSLGLVNAQHHARKQYIELEQISQDAKQYEQEYGQLQLEQSTWAMHSRVELIASQQLQMQVPDSKRVQVVVQHTAIPLKVNSVLPPASDTQQVLDNPSATTDISVKVGVQDNAKEPPESQVEQAYRVDTLNRKQNLSSATNKTTANKNVPPKAPSRLTLAPPVPTSPVEVKP